MSSAASPPRKRTKTDHDSLFANMFNIHNSFLQLLTLLLDDETKDDETKDMEIVVQTLESQIAMSQQGMSDDDDDWANSREPIDRFYTIFRSRSNRRWLISDDLGRRNYKPTFFKHRLIMNIHITHANHTKIRHILSNVIKNMCDIPNRKKAGYAKLWRVTIEVTDNNNTIYYHVIKNDKHTYPLMHQSNHSSFPKNNPFATKFNLNTITDHIQSIAISPPLHSTHAWFKVTKFLEQTLPESESSGSRASSNSA